MYYLYILKCADQSLYTGIAVDVEKRVHEHNTSYLGAKYTHSRRPVELIYTAQFTTRSKALIEEARIKKLSRAQKLHLIKTRVSDYHSDTNEEPLSTTP